MTEMAEEFRSWIGSYVETANWGETVFTTAVPDGHHVRIFGGDQVGSVTFYEIEPNVPEIVELSVMSDCGEAEPTFFLHFEMDDLPHAKKLVVEMLDVMRNACMQRPTRVLLSCTSAMTTTLFANRMAEVASQLAMDIEFEAMPVEAALHDAGDYDVVMLAPQAHARREEIAKRHPDTIVFEIPGAVFGSYDAVGAVRLLMGVLNEGALAARMERTDSHIIRKTENDKRILVIGAIYGVDTSIYQYRVYEAGHVVLNGLVRRGAHNYADVRDVGASVRMHGYVPSDFDAIGIALPGMVDGSAILMGGRDGQSFDFGDLDALMGVPVFLDNNANAAAAGCYVSQEEHESLLVHSHPTGYPNGGQGLIVDGRLVVGNHGLAGELGFLARMLGVREQMRDLAWTPEGMLKLVAAELMHGIVATSPEAIYVAVDLLPDLAELCELLARWLPEGAVPELVPVRDYHERVMMGEYALCLDRLLKGVDGRV